MVKILLFIWQLPQHLVALIIYLINIKNITKEEVNGTTVYLVKYCMNCGVSLGNFIFLDRDIYIYINKYLQTVKHEKGHQVQSKYLGWFYLPVIGFTSAICNNLWDRIAHKKWTQLQRTIWYYSRFPENWADKLGGVIRHYYE